MRWRAGPAVAEIPVVRAEISGSPDKPASSLRIQPSLLACRPLGTFHEEGGHKLARVPPKKDERHNF